MYGKCVSISQREYSKAMVLAVLVVVSVNIILLRRLSDSVDTEANIIVTRKQIDIKPTSWSENERPKVKLYSRARKDRGGAAVLDALLCHAYAFQENAMYGGICVDENSNKESLPHLEDQQSLIHTLGLQHELPFACPTDRSGILMREEDYFAQDTLL